MQRMQLRSAVAATCLGLAGLLPSEIGFAQWTERVTPRPSWYAALSGNGRFVIYADQPDVEDFPGDFWLHDVLTGASVLSDWSALTLSADGRFLAVLRNTAAPSDPPVPHFDLFLRQTDRRTYELISASATGAPSNGNSLNEAAISADGRFVAFISEASNLVEGDASGGRNVFVRDRQLKTTERVTASESGGYLFSNARRVSISADGRYVAFTADAFQPGLGTVPGQVFVRDRVSGAVQAASVNDAGEFSNASVRGFALSGDGRSLAFDPDYADNLVDGDENFSGDIFVRDLERGLTTLVSMSSSGERAETFHEDDFDGGPAISANGRFVAFSSGAGNLVAGDTNGRQDVFVHDRWNLTTERVSVSSSGLGGVGISLLRGISDDGRIVAFLSSSALIDGEPDLGRHIYVRFREGSSGDRDGDGIDAAVDNCPATPNSGQQDADGNSFGDACVPIGSLDPRARLGPDPIVGAGTRIGRGADIGSGARIGSRVSIERDAVAGHALQIGDRSRLERGVQLGNDVRLGAAVQVRRDAHIGSSAFIEDRVRVERDSRVGDRARISAEVTLGASVTVGADAFVGPGSALARGSSLGSNSVLQDAVALARDVAVGADVWIGERALIGRNSSIGDRAHIGGGAVLGSSVTVAAGAVVPDGARIPDGTVVLW